MLAIKRTKEHNQIFHKIKEKKVKQFFAYLVMVILFVSIAPAHLAYSMTSFGSTNDLSGPSTDPVSQQIVASGNNVYVVWSNNGHIFFSKSIDNGATFSGPAVNLSNLIGGQSSPQIAVSGNNVYVVWSNAAAGNPQIF